VLINSLTAAALQGSFVSFRHLDPSRFIQLVMDK